MELDIYRNRCYLPIYPLFLWVIVCVLQQFIDKNFLAALRQLFVQSVKCSCNFLCSTCWIVNDTIVQTTNNIFWIYRYNLFSLINTKSQRIRFKKNPSKPIVGITIEFIRTTKKDCQVLHTTFFIFNFCKVRVADISDLIPTFCTFRTKLTDKLVVFQAEACFYFFYLCAIVTLFYYNGLCLK